eukprot:1829565-Rhodomonas_salina.1
MPLTKTIESAPIAIGKRADASSVPQPLQKRPAVLLLPKQAFSLPCIAQDRIIDRILESRCRYQT